MIALAGQSTARAGLRSKLAALVVRRQAPPNPRKGERLLFLRMTSTLHHCPVGAGHARPAALPLPPIYLLLRREGS